jgi:geranylgeranyl diphosphate synthase type II
VTFGDEDYLRLVLKKTCWYSFIHPCRIGATVARGSRVDPDTFNRFGYLIGAAFQIQDDVLNLIGMEKRYGKEIGGDLWEGKRTLMLAHLFRSVTGAEAARLAGILGKPRADRLPREIYWLLDLLKQRGSIEYARDAARQLAKEAQHEFESAYSDARDGEDREFVRGLVQYVVERDM